MCYLLGFHVTRYNKLGSLNNRNLLSHRSGGQKSELKILKDNIERYSGGRGGEGESVPVLSRRLWRSSAFLDSSITSFSTFIYTAFSPMSVCVCLCSNASLFNWIVTKIVRSYLHEHSMKEDIFSLFCSL